MAASLYRALFCTGTAESPLFRLEDGTSQTYGEVDTRAAKLAGALVELGLEPGQRLVVQVDKSVDAFALYLACLRAGIVYVPLNTAYTKTEVAYFVEDAKASAVVCRPGSHETLKHTLGRTRLFSLGADGEGSLSDAAKNSHPAPVHEPHEGDIACMLYTSGTTGRSKGAMLSNACLISNAKALHTTWAFEPGDTLLHALPIFHVHGLFIALNVAMLGGHAVFYLGRFDAEQVCACLPQATVFMGVPTYYARLLSTASFGAEVCGNIRLFTSGSAPMTEQLHEAFTERTGHRICERYGMTECGIITSNPYEGERVPGTVGYALPGYRVRVRDDIVQVAGEHLFSGYWERPEQTHEAFTDDGWFITGDIGQLSEDERLSLRGRASDMVISGGLNVYPREIEVVINETPGAIETAVIGVTHPDFGEGIVAVVVLEKDFREEGFISEAQRRCEVSLARFKHPKRWVFVDTLPRNAMSKVQKNVLRERFAHILSSQNQFL